MKLNTATAKNIESSKYDRNKAMKELIAYYYKLKDTSFIIL